jgi:hypothetical protein
MFRAWSARRKAGSRAGRSVSPAVQAGRAAAPCRPSPTTPS